MSRKEPGGGEWWQRWWSRGGRKVKGYIQKRSMDTLEELLERELQCLKMDSDLSVTWPGRGRPPSPRWLSSPLGSHNFLVGHLQMQPHVETQASYRPFLWRKLLILIKSYIYIYILFFSFFFGLFRAAPTAYGGS